MFKKVVLDNFKSFGHLELDLTGVKDAPLGHAAIFGENGSGKTNIVEAFRFLLDSTRTLALQEDGPIGESGHDCPLREGLKGLAGESRTIGSDGIMKLAFTFTADGRDAAYSMYFDGTDTLVSECLECRMGKRMTTVFSISGKGENGRSERFHRSFRNDTVLWKDIRKRIGSQWGTHSALSIFRHERSQHDTGSVNGAGIDAVFRTLDYLDDVRVLLHGRVEGGMDLESGVIPSDRRNVLDGYGIVLTTFFGNTSSDIRRVRYDVEEDRSDLRYNLVFEKRVGGIYRDVPVQREALGTRNLLKLVPLFMDYDSGKVVVVDGIDTGIHCRLLRLVLDEILDRGKGQMLFTTHNTSLLKSLDPRSAYILRQSYDLKDIAPISSLARNRRNDDNEERYLNGIFAGIPYIAFLDMGITNEIFDEALEGDGQGEPEGPLTRQCGN